MSQIFRLNRLVAGAALRAAISSFAMRCVLLLPVLCAGHADLIHTPAPSSGSIGMGQILNGGFPAKLPDSIVAGIGVELQDPALSADLQQSPFINADALTNYAPSTIVDSNQEMEAVLKDLLMQVQRDTMSFERTGVQDGEYLSVSGIGKSFEQETLLAQDRVATVSPIEKRATRFDHKTGLIVPEPGSLLLLCFGLLVLGFRQASLRRAG